MADKTLKMWLQHVNSQVAEILNDYSRCLFLWNILQLLYMPFSCSPCPPPPFLFPSLLPFSFILLFLLFLGRAAVSGEKNTLLKPIRHFYNASLVVGKRGREEQRLMGKDDICGGCVPTLLQPIVINHSYQGFFFPRAALSAHCFRKAIVFFSCHNPEEKKTRQQVLLYCHRHHPTRIVPFLGETEFNWPFCTCMLSTNLVTQSLTKEL